MLSIRRNRAGLAGDISGLRTRRIEAGDTEYSGAAIIYSVIKRIVRGTESVREQSDDVLVREWLESVSILLCAYVYSSHTVMLYMSCISFSILSVCTFDVYFLITVLSGWLLLCCTVGYCTYLLLHS